MVIEHYEAYSVEIGDTLRIEDHDWVVVRIVTDEELFGDLLYMVLQDEEGELKAIKAEETAKLPVLCMQVED
jgi:hypothetical protein